MFDVITFGSATNDIFLKVGKNMRLIAGRKILVDDLQIHSGGGGTNVACALSHLGLKTAYVGRVGDDDFGKRVFADLKKFKVETRFVEISKTEPTAISVIVSPVKKDRIAFVYQGACHKMSKTNIPCQRIKQTKWFYIGPLRGRTTEILQPLLKFAKKQGIKLAVNPSKEQAKTEGQFLLKNVDVLIVNQVEAKAIGKFKKAKAIVVITKGNKGSVVYQKGQVFQVGILANVPLIEKTGAGDAYAAGFLAGLFQKDNIEYAIQVASNNAAACISQVGAKNGLLKSQI